MLPQPLSDVPQDKVGHIVQDFIDLDGVQELNVVKQADGKFTITPIR